MSQHLAYQPTPLSSERDKDQNERPETVYVNLSILGEGWERHAKLKMLVRNRLAELALVKSGPHTSCLDHVVPNGIKRTQLSLASFYQESGRWTFTELGTGWPALVSLRSTQAFSREISTQSRIERLAWHSGSAEHFPPYYVVAVWNAITCPT